MSNYIPVIGLEIHAELLTKSKVFCTCSAEFGGSQNTRCCPVCTGMPGTLPVINQTAVQYAVKAGFALGCHINKFSVFDRKNYFYPDLPKAYQISQLQRPLCLEGLVEIETSADKKDIRINRIHLEEDAGKLIHDDFNAVSLADYNRCGIPLIEIVTEPDISSAEEAKAFVEKISLLLQYAGVCDCKMEQGSLRCDVNISIMRPEDKELGTRAEIKNLNSLKSITRAINYEIKRQSRLLDAGKRVVQETRRFNDNKGETSSMRSKENAHDYRYFPEPDILQVNFTDEMLDEIKAMLQELPHKRLKRYIKKYGLSKTDAQIIVNQKRISDFYDEAVAAYYQPKSIANFIIVELLRRVNLGEVSMESLPFSAQEFATLVKMADTEQVSKNDAKKILRTMIETGKDAKTIASEARMLIQNDTAKAKSTIAEVLEKNSEAVAQYQNGEKKVFGFLMGLCTKKLRGVCTPAVIKGLLKKKLSETKLTATSEKNMNEHHETEEVAYACTAYANPNAYCPNSKDGILQIGSENLVSEFEFSDATDHINETITICACVHKIRQMSEFAFIILRTGRYIIQSIYHSDQCKDSINGLREGNYICVSGVVQQNEKAVGGVELQLESLQVISNSNEEYPLKVSNKKLGCGLDINLDNRSVSLRNIYQRAIFRIQEGVVSGFREFMLQEGFTEIHTPKIVAQGAEGGANIFHLEYFDKPAFLNQSPQFYKQTAVAFFDRVFEIAPVYRAEKHATSRHINEYIGLDFEMGYIDSMYDVMAMETAMLKHLMTYLKTNYTYEIDLLHAEIPEITEIPCFTLLEAKEILGSKGSKNKLDLEPEDEVAICTYAKQTFDSDFIFVTHFPSSKPPFYAMNSREDPRLAYKFDLLFRGLEITSGGQRIHDYQEQLDKMHAQGLNPEDFKYYLEAHKYGLPPHGGLGIGLERLVMKLLGLSNVRQVSMFPRDINRLLP
ncbi:MAG: Asp-tRNA(Asn)/Glu-tRNA(Gln) amidotransferase subunit GatB [Ruminococcus sp.]|nr:Asp-tRNA(Asn)/Glu-tRNA(Gln) amidotransferase subunit GatB [Ruminococcus sp.]